MSAPHPTTAGSEEQVKAAVPADLHPNHLPDLRYIRMFLLGLADKEHRSGDLAAALNGIDYIIKRTEEALATSAPPPVEAREPLTNERLDEALGAAYRKLVLETGYSGGMGSESWDRAAARAIEAAHGIVAATHPKERTEAPAQQQGGA